MMSQNPRVLYHGGVPRLGVGQVLLPPTITGALCVHDNLPDADIAYDETVVYLTADLDLARLYAAAHRRRDRVFGQITVGRGDIYKVEPIGPIRPDPYYQVTGWPDLAWTAPAAGILQVVERRCTLPSDLTPAQVQSLIRATQPDRTACALELGALCAR